MTFGALAWPRNLFVFIFVLFFALNLRLLLDHDVWFQLLAGQETLRTLGVPKAEFYIYSVLGEPSIFVGWLWGLLLYLTWIVGGYVSVSLFNALVWGGMFVVAVAAILARVAHEAPIEDSCSKRALVLAALIATGVAYQYLVERSVQRAEVTLYLAWVIAVFMSVGVASDRQRTRRFLLVVPLLSWSLGWFHTTSIFMVLLLAGYLLQVGVNAIRDGGATGFQAFVRVRSWPWLVSMLAAVVLPCLNPNGVQQALPLISGIVDVLHGIFIGEQSRHSAVIVHGNLEYMKLSDVPGAWPVAGFFFAASVTVLWGDKSHRAANSLFLAVGMLLSFVHVRALALWAVFLMIPLGVALAPLLHRAIVVLNEKGRGALVSTLIIMCCLWNIGTLFNKEGGRWGIGYRPDQADEHMLEAIRTNMPDGGRIFNWHPVGAYLRWHLGPKFLVAMDGHLVDAKSPAWKAYYDIRDSPESGLALIDKWGIQAVYNPALTIPAGNIHWLAHELVGSENWLLVSRDRYGLLFVRTKKGRVDERTRNVLKIAYWRKVLVEATFNLINSSNPRDTDRARKVVEHAKWKIDEIQAQLN